jgi:DNA polymerase III subunit delta
VPAFKPAYLVLGDDHGRISERRAKLRALAEAESGASGVEVLEGDLCTADEVVNALSTMTFALGRRFVIADGVECWKDADAEAVAAAMEAMDGETLTLAMFGREEGRNKVPDGLRTAVEAAGGAIAEESAIKPWELPSWLQARARELGLELDKAGARALVASVGERQQRLLRELEKLALEHGTGAELGEAEVVESSASSAQRKIWTLGDALVAGDERTAMRALVELRAQGERLPGLLYNVANRLRDAVKVAEALAAGQTPAQARQGLRMSPRVASKFVDGVAKRDVDAFRRALEVMADLELESRGGGAGGGALDEDTQAVRAVVAAAS